MKTSTIELLHVEGHRCSFDDLTDELFIGGEYAGRILLENEYVQVEGFGGEFVSEAIHENHFEDWSGIVRWAASLIINN